VIRGNRDGPAAKQKMLKQPDAGLPGLPKHVRAMIMPVGVLYISNRGNSERLGRQAPAFEVRRRNFAAHAALARNGSIFAMR
jgi:hypothetical protein